MHTTAVMSAGVRGGISWIVTFVSGCDVVKDTWAPVALVVQGRIVVVEVRAEMLLYIFWQYVRYS